MFRLSLVVTVLATVVTSVPNREQERHQVIVVGAGVSGFTAAATLLENNITDVLVLEAADRIGGRIHTVEFGGVVIEKGAEFVHGEIENSVYDLVKRYDLLTSYKAILKEDSFLLVNTSSFTFKNSVVLGLVEEAYSIFKEEGVKHFNGSLAEYFYPKLDTLLSSKNVDQHLREALRYLVPLIELTVHVGDDLSEFGAWGYSDILHPEGDLTLKWKPETKGYKTIFDILSKKYPNPSEELPVLNKTVLGKQVTKIEQREGDVEVTCADGTNYLADHVIVTVSLGVLKKHAATMFHPALSADKTTAIEKMGFGCVAKVLLLFPTRWWPKHIKVIAPILSQHELQDFIANSKHGSWSSRIIIFQQVMNHERMLLTWLSGKPCWNLDSLSDEVVIDGVMELLKKLVGDKFDIPRPESMIRTEWATYPHTLGSNSFRTVESDQLNITQDVLAEPIFHGGKPVILFAGEATNHKKPCLLNGALDTGRREAHNIINFLNKKA